MREFFVSLFVFVVVTMSGCATLYVEGVTKDRQTGGTIVYHGWATPEQVVAMQQADHEVILGSVFDQSEGTRSALRWQVVYSADGSQTNTLVAVLPSGEIADMHKAFDAESYDRLKSACVHPEPDNPQKRRKAIVHGKNYTEYLDCESPSSQTVASANSHQLLCEFWSQIDPAKFEMYCK